MIPQPMRATEGSAAVAVTVAVAVAVGVAVAGGCRCIQTTVV